MENEQINNSAVDTKALKKELEDFIVIAKKEKEKIETLSISISTKSEEIELYYATFSDLRAKLTDNRSGMQALFDQATNLKNQIDQVSTNAQTQLDQINEKTSAINTKIQEVEDYYGTFVGLKDKLGDGQTGLQALLDQSTILKNSITAIDVKARAVLDEINKNLASITEKVKEIEGYYTATFVPLRNKVEDPKIGIQATLNLVTDLKDEIVKTKTSTDQRFKEVQSLTEKSAELKKNAENSVNDIESIKIKSIEFKDSIGETLDLVTASSLTDSFIKRRDAISKNARFWKWVTLASVILLGAAVLYIYFIQSEAVDGFKDFSYWYRYFFTSPLIYLVYLSDHNYNLERNYEEKYAFKTVLSTSLQAYIKLLDDKFSDKKDDLLKFALASIERIYKEPYMEKDKNTRFNFGWKIFNGGFERSENSISEKEKDNTIKTQKPTL